MNKKIFWIIFCILIIIFTLNFSRNLIILNKSNKKMQEYGKYENFTIKINKNSNEKIITKNGNYYKIEDNEKNIIIYFNEETKETNAYDKTTNSPVEYNLNNVFISFDHLQYNNMIITSLLNVILKENNNYKFKKGNTIYWIDKDTGLISKIYENNEFVDYEYAFSSNHN